MVHREQKMPDPRMARLTDNLAHAGWESPRAVRKKGVRHRRHGRQTEGRAVPLLKHVLTGQPAGRAAGQRLRAVEALSVRVTSLVSP